MTQVSASSSGVSVDASKKAGGEYVVLRVVLMLMRSTTAVHHLSYFLEP